MCIFIELTPIDLNFKCVLSSNANKIQRRNLSINSQVNVKNKAVDSGFGFMLHSSWIIKL